MVISWVTSFPTDSKAIVWTESQPSQERKVHFYRAQGGFITSLPRVYIKIQCFSINVEVIILDGALSLLLNQPQRLAVGITEHS